MAISINFCLKLSPQTLPSTSSIASTNPQKTTQSPWSWRNSCFSCAAVASFVISYSLAFSMDGSYDFVEDLGVLVETQSKAKRWSERRTCPQWHANTLENIVPENLPRRSGNRWRSIAMKVHQNIDPRVGVLTHEDVRRCFYL